jgi:hypothetical protein
LPQSFDLTIGMEIRRSLTGSCAMIRQFRTHGPRLHDFFIVKAIDRLKAGGLAGFVTSHRTMDKADNRARAQIASMADLVGAIRLPEGSFRAAAGTEVGVDLLFFRKLRTGKWQDQADHDRYIAHTTGRPADLHDVVRSLSQAPLRLPDSLMCRRANIPQRRHEHALSLCRSRVHPFDTPSQPMVSASGNHGRIPRRSGAASCSVLHPLRTCRRSGPAPPRMRAV